MRISFISTMAAVTWGGSELLWHETAQAALQAKHEVFTLTPDIQPRPSAIDELINAGATCFFWNCLNRTSEINVEDILPEFYPYQPLIDWRPDLVVISHGGMLDIIHGHLLLAKLLLTQLLPYVVIIQANTEQYKPSDTLRPIIKAYLLGANSVFFVSKQNKQIAEKQLVSSINNAQIINNPINLPAPTSLAFPELTNETTIQFASVARLDIACKGQDVLLEVLSDPVWRERNWHLNFFGLGPDEHYLKELVQFYQLQNKVTFKGYVQDIKAIWDQHHLLLLPSRIEGTPLVLLEAMACARSAVVTAIGGNGEWIRDEELGYVAEAPFPSLFSKAMERAWSDRNRWKLLGERCHRYFKSRHEGRPGLTLLSFITSIKKNKAKSTSIDDEKPLVSIIVPCYKLGQYLSNCITSIAYQTYLNIEVIIVNPSSPDCTLSIAESLARDYPDRRIQCLTTEHFGQPALSRAAGVQLARGDYLLFLDADDMIAPTFVEKTVAALEKEPTAKIAFPNYQSFEKSNDISRTGPLTLEAIAIQNRLPICSLMRRSVWDDVGGFTDNCPGFEDWDFWISCAELGMQGIHIPEILFYYRVRNGSLLTKAKQQREKLTAQLILNHPSIYTEETIRCAKEILA